jgi:hypothetical protein
MKDEIGSKIWVIPGGFIPAYSRGEPPHMISHETASILNVTDSEAHLEITIYFEDKEPVGPYKFIVPARRTNHIRFNDLNNPSIPTNTNYASVISSNVPIIVQHTRLDTRESANAIFSTVAYSTNH